MMMQSKSVVVIIPTTGKSTLQKCLQSLSEQAYDNLRVLVVIDGDEYAQLALPIINSINMDIDVCILPRNVGSGGWYGHRVYATFPLLVDEDYILFLDEDNFLEYNHIHSMVNTCESRSLDWCYSLRRIVDEGGEFLAVDDCESLGMWAPYTNYNHVDTSCYCISLETARKFSSAIFGRWGADRKFYGVLSKNSPNYGTTGQYTLNYRLSGNDNSVKYSFFEHGNAVVHENYLGNTFPWRNG